MTKLGQAKLLTFQGNPIYAFFLAMDWEGDACYVRPRIMQCFRDYKFDPQRHDIRIRVTNIKIQICDVLSAKDHTIFKYGHLHHLIADDTTAILYYKGPQNPEIVNLEPIPPIDRRIGRVLRVDFAHCLHPRTGERLDWIFCEAREGEEGLHDP